MRVDDLTVNARLAAREATERLGRAISALESELLRKRRAASHRLRPRLLPDVSFSDLAYALRSCIRAEDPGAERRLLQAWAGGDSGLACLSVRSGFDLLLEALALEPGDEVAVSAITHPDMVRILEAHGLLGVTDTPVEGSAPSAQPTDEDVATIIAWFRDVLPEGDLRADCVLSSFAGFRVLPPGRVGTARASRRQTIHPPDVRPRNLRPSADPLPGALLAGARAAVAHRVEPRTAAHLLGLYGGEAVRVLEYEDAVPDALEPIHPDGPDIWAQAHFALDEEMAVAAEDIASRRTTLMLRGWLQRRS